MENKTTEILFLSPEVVDEELTIRPELKEKIHDIKALLEQIEKEKDLTDYVPMVRTILDEFLSEGQLIKRKEAFKKLSSHHPELYKILCWAMEEHKTKLGLERLKREATKKINATETASSPNTPKYFPHTKTRKVEIKDSPAKTPRFVKK